MPTTETVRTDYRRRRKKNEKSIWRKTEKLPKVKKNQPPLQWLRYYLSLCSCSSTLNSANSSANLSKPWMRSVQFYYTYCYTKYRKNQSLK